MNFLQKRTQRMLNNQSGSIDSKCIDGLVFFCWLLLYIQYFDNQSNFFGNKSIYYNIKFSDTAYFFISINIQTNAKNFQFLCETLNEKPPGNFEKPITRLCDSFKTIKSLLYSFLSNFRHSPAT